MLVFTFQQIQNKTWKHPKGQIPQFLFHLVKWMLRGNANGMSPAQTWELYYLFRSRPSPFHSEPLQPTKMRNPPLFLNGCQHTNPVFENVPQEQEQTGRKTNFVISSPDDKVTTGAESHPKGRSSELWNLVTLFFPERNGVLDWTDDIYPPPKVLTKGQWMVKHKSFKNTSNLLASFPLFLMSRNTNIKSFMFKTRSSKQSVYEPHIQVTAQRCISVTPRIQHAVFSVDLIASWVGARAQTAPVPRAHCVQALHLLRVVLSCLHMPSLSRGPSVSGYPSIYRRTGAGSRVFYLAGSPWALNR